MIFQSVMYEMLYFISCLHAREIIEEIRILFLFGHVCFITDASKIFVTTF